jgi:hypothetical protein
LAPTNDLDLESDQGRVGRKAVPNECLSDKIVLRCEEGINVVSVNKTNCQLGIFYPPTPCTMFRQMLLRPSLRPVSRSFPYPTQLAKRAFHHKHSSKHHHNPRSSSHKCCRHIPIQSSSALLQIGPSFKRHPTSYVPSSSHTFHSTRSVQGSPLALIGLFSALKVRPTAANELPWRQFTCFFFLLPALDPPFLVFCNT